MADIGMPGSGPADTGSAGTLPARKSNAGGTSLLPARESGAALPLAVFTLALVSILGLVLTMRATTEMRISDNSESHLRAAYAAMSGLEHARMLARGLDFDALLRGPDGVYDTGAAYRTEAKRFSFRLPLPIPMARTLDPTTPLASGGILHDDGIISNGALFGVAGTELIPKAGIAQWTDDPRGPVLVSRYFVKVSDNNGEASELAGDAGDNPFVDGDGIVVVRAVGVAGTFAEQVGGTVRRNSVAVYESRLKRAATWDLGSALTVIGPAANVAFTGTPEIAGGAGAGIGVLDTNILDADSPESALRGAAAGIGTITGGGLPEPSVRDMTAIARADRDKAMPLDARRLRDFIERRVPRMADQIYIGKQIWLAGAAPFLGAYDKGKPWNDPGQKPRLTLVRGDLLAPDGLAGAGVLVVTGKLECAGTMDWRGLVLVLGEGDLALGCDGPGVSGGLVIGKWIVSGVDAAFGIPRIAVGGNTRLVADRAFVRMALRLFPVERISFREIAGSDP